MVSRAHGRPQAWAWARGTGTCAPIPGSVLCKVLFLLHMLSRVSVDEVCIILRKYCQLLGASSQDPSGVLSLNPQG